MPPDNSFPLNSATPTQIEEKLLSKAKVAISPAKPPRKPRLTITFAQRITLVKFLESRLLIRETRTDLKFLISQLEDFSRRLSALEKKAL